MLSSEDRESLVMTLDFPSPTGVALRADGSVVDRWTIRYYLVLIRYGPEYCLGVEGRNMSVGERP